MKFSDFQDNNFCKKINNSSLAKKLPFLSSGEKKEDSPIDFSLLLIIKSTKIKGKAGNKTINIDDVKTLINDSRYFLVEKQGENTLKEAKTSAELPDLNKDRLFILKITGQATPDISKYPTKSWLRDNITSETCQLEAVLHLLDGSIAERFVPTI